MTNVSRLYVYNICSSSIPNLNETHFDKHDQYTSKICVFCVDKDGKNIVFTCPFRPFILFKFKEKNVMIDESDTVLDEINDLLFKGYEHFTIEQDIQTPLFSYTKSRKDTLYKLYYDKLWSRQRLVDHLHEFGFGTEDGTNLGAVYVYHQNTLKNEAYHQNTLSEKKERRPGVKDEQLFMQTTDLRNHIWIDVKLPRQHSHPRNVSKHIVKMYENVLPSNIEMLPDILDQPPLSIVYLRTHAISSTATATNWFQADPKIPGDKINIIVLLHQDLKQKDVKDEKDITVLQNTNEIQLLQLFNEYIKKTNPHIIIQCSDLQNDLEYLCVRAKEKDLGLCLFNDLPVNLVYTEEKVMDVIVKEKLMDIVHVGRERIDLIPVLQKFQVNPPLKQFTLRDVYLHPKLIQKKKRKVQLDTFPLHIKSSNNEIEIRLKQELLLMYYLVSDVSVIESQCLLARFCDVNVQTICERGVEVQTRSCFLRAALKRKLYANYERIENSQFLVVKRKRADSSFPHPEQLHNPSIQEILGQNVQRKKPKFSMKQYFEEVKGEQTTQHTTKKSKKGYSGGFVVTPEPGYYVNPRLAAAILDFKSLYPSVICGYLICYMSVLYESESEYLTDPHVTLRFVPLDDDHCCVFVVTYDNEPVETLVPEVTEEIMTRREKLKILMEAAIDPHEKSMLDCRQLTAKVQANG